MSFDLDPKEVLQHLHALGYCNISPELLKEFIRGSYGSFILFSHDHDSVHIVIMIHFLKYDYMFWIY